MKISFNKFIPLLGLILLSCTQTPVEITGGSGSETVIGQLADRDGTFSENITVRLVPHNFNPSMQSSLILTTTTDSCGRFQIKADPGIYNLEAVSNENGARLFISGIQKEQNRSEIIPADTLKKPIDIIFPIPENFSGKIYFEGTTITKDISSSVASVIIDSLAPGIYPKVILVSDDGISQTVMENAAIDTSSITIPDVKIPTRVFINTGSDGAAIMEDLYSFPLLLKLNSSNFDFTSSTNTGMGIHFSKSDGSSLPFEIESWDSANGKADVWVKLDTIKGNSASQSFYMYCDTLKRETSSPSIVFDTGNGHLSVFHFTRSDSNVVDATAYRLQGKSGNTPDSSPVAGSAEPFTGGGEHLNMGNPAQLNLNGPFTISAWVNTNWDSPQPAYLFFIDKYEKDRTIDTNGIETGFTFYYQYPRLRLTIYGGTSGVGNAKSVELTGNGWKYIAAIYDGADIKLFADGEELALNTYTKPTAPPALNQNDFLIGIRDYTSEELDFVGEMDELRISSVPRSSAYIKMSYQNQKTGSTVVHFER